MSNIFICTYTYVYKYISQKCLMTIVHNVIISDIKLFPYSYLTNKNVLY